MASTPQPSDLTAYLARPSEAELEFRRLFHASEPLVICDIGACEGEDSVRYARLFPRARIFAFEPLPANQALVRDNFERFAVRNAELVAMALSDRAGEAVFHVSSGRPKEMFSGEQWNYGNKSSSLLPPAQDDPMYGWIEFKQEITVQTETLDNFCRARGLDHIDFIHMDVQGAEYLVLSGAGFMLPRTKALWLEVSDQQLYRGQKLRTDIEQFMHEHNFALGMEIRREIEGDQFYVNRRFAGVWPYLATKRAMKLARRLRFTARRLKSRLVNPTPSP
jgi:FkbM family methyltransferase